MAFSSRHNPRILSGSQLPISRHIVPGEMATTFESLPPLVLGAHCGKLFIKPKKLSLKDGTFPVNYTMRFEWWGQKGAPISLACPWKSGMPEPEAVFPILAEASVLEEYLRDMSELVIEIVDKGGKVVGKGTLSLVRLVEGGLQDPQLRLTVYSIKASTNSSKKTLGELQLSIIAAFDRSPLEEGFSPPPTAQPPTGLAPLPSDATPQRAERVPQAAEPNFGVTSFQRNEVRWCIARDSDLPHVLILITSLVSYFRH